MGAKISGISSNLLSIEGVGALKGCTHRLLPDMIEVGSFIGLAAMTQSEITIKNVGYEHLGIIPDTFSRLGIHLEEKGMIFIFLHKKIMRSIPILMAPFSPLPMRYGRGSLLIC